MINTHLEQVKHIAERLTGLARPPEHDLPGLLRDRKPNAYRFRDDGQTPNNPSLPLIHYRSPIRLAEDYDPAAVFEVLFASNGWKESWRDGVYDFLHFHTRTHEVLGIARGEARVQFGGKNGRTLHVKAGDVVVLPAGTGHRRRSASRDLLVVGAYPENGGGYDEPTPRKVDHDEALALIAKVKRPAADPVYGRRGPLRELWR
jgi:uncharacterized protein YjlB